MLQCIGLNCCVVPGSMHWELLRTTQAERVQGRVTNDLRRQILSLQNKGAARTLPATGSASNFPQVPFCYLVPSFCTQNSNHFKEISQFFLLPGMNSCPGTINWSNPSHSQTNYICFTLALELIGNEPSPSPSNAFLQGEEFLGGNPSWR